MASCSYRVGSGCAAAILPHAHWLRDQFSATPTLGSGSLEVAFVSGVPAVISEKATRTNDAATFVCVSMTVPPLVKRKRLSQRCVLCCAKSNK
jgi:hypothetical protein